MLSTPTIKDFYSKKSKAGDVGIEIEVEFPVGEIPPHSPGGAWRSDADASLFNGMEYITRQPIKVGPDKLEKIKFLMDGIAGSKPIEGKGSIHVHRNVLDFTPVQVWSTIIAYWLLEQPLISFCGEKRKGYMFCQSISETLGILKVAEEDLARKDKPFSSFHQDNAKYASQNLACISKIGSLEYRSMRGTLDPALIDLWSTTVWHIGEQAKLFKDPSALMDFYLNSQKDQFLLTLLPEGMIEYLRKDTVNYESIIRKTALHVADIAYFHDDWDKWQNSLIIPKKATEEIPDLDVAVARLNRMVLNPIPVRPRNWGQVVEIE